MWLPGVILGFVVIIVLIWLVVRQIRESGEIGRWDALNQEDMQQLVNEIQDVAENVHEMNVRAEHAIKQLRNAADYLDKVWKDCRIASAVGTGANIAGGVLSIAGGMATIMTAGAAVPLLVAGGALGVAGSCSNIGTAVVEKCINSSIVQETDEAVRNANRAIEKVQKLFNAIKTGKNQVRLVLMAGMAIRMLDKNHLLVKLLKDVVHPDMWAKALPSVMTALNTVTELAVGAMGKVVSAVEGRLLEGTSKQGMTIGVNVGSRTCTSSRTKLGTGTAKNVRTKLTAKGAKRVGKPAGAKATQEVGTKVETKAASKAAAGKVIIGVNAVFLVLDAMELAMTVRDIVENQGSEAARSLRCKADEYEALLDAS